MDNFTYFAGFFDLDCNDDLLPNEYDFPEEFETLGEALDHIRESIAYEAGRRESFAIEISRLDYSTRLDYRVLLVKVIRGKVQSMTRYSDGEAQPDLVEFMDELGYRK